jgi:hypothetical protein
MPTINATINTAMAAASHIQTTIRIGIKNVHPGIGISEQTARAAKPTRNTTAKGRSPAIIVSMPRTIGSLSRYHYTMPHSYPYLSHLLIGHIIAYRCER